MRLIYTAAEGCPPPASEGEPEHSIAPIGGRGGVLFLDVNGDGLPDAIETGFQNQQPLTFLNSGDGFLAPVPSLPVATPDADRYIKLAVPIDYDGDGRQDVLVPMPVPGGVPAWTILQAQGGPTAGTFALVDPEIPFDAEIQGDSVTLADRRGPRVTDVDGDGAPDLVLGLAGTLHVFRNQLGDVDLLATVTDGLAAHDPGEAGWVPSVAIRYAHLIDRAVTQGLAPTSAKAEAETYLARVDEAKDCTYPLRCVAGSRRVVSGYAIDKGGAKPRTFAAAYRDGRFHRLGRGFLGFGERILRDLDTGAGTIEQVDLTTFDASLGVFPFVGQVAHRFTYNPGRPGDPDPHRIELSFTDTAAQIKKTQGGASYFTLPVLERTRREQGTFPPHPQSKLTVEAYTAKIAAQNATILGDSTTLVTDYDAYGNVEGETTTTAGVDLTLHKTRVFSNDEGDWLIGRLASETACSTAAGKTLCRTDARTYDSRGRVRTETLDGDGGAPEETHLALTYHRDVFGNIVATVARDGTGEIRTACTYYDAQGVFPRAQRNPAGHLSFTRFDAGLGALTLSIDPNGLATRWAYDGFGRVAEERRADGTGTTFAQTRTHEADSGWTVRLSTKTDGQGDDSAQLDPQGRPVRWWSPGVQVGAAPVPRVMQEITWDELGEHVASRSLPASEDTAPDVLHRDRYRYDSSGRVLRHETPWKGLTIYSYDGAKVRVMDPLGFVTTIANDGLGRPTEITDALGGVTSYGYGPFGRVRAVTDPGGATTWTQRDAFGRALTMHDPDRGTTKLHYDGFGQTRSSVDAQNRTILFTYDGLGRRTARLDDDGMTTWVWDQGAHGIGQLAKVSGPDGTEEAFTYDGLGRPKTSSLTRGGETFTIALAYDASSRVATIAYPQGDGIAPFSVNHVYDPSGHLLSVRDAASDDPYWTLLDADGMGRVHVEALGAAITTTRTYDEAKNRLASLVTTGDAGPLQHLSYGYDSKLNLEARSDALQGKTEYFRYDPLDRLRCASFTDGFSCNAPYTYEPNGNLAHKPHVGDYVYAPDHPHAVIAAGSASYDYDATGNQISRPGMTVDYTATNRPLRFTMQPSGRTIDLDYDGEGHRVRKRDGKQETITFAGRYERTTHLGSGLVEHRYFVQGAGRVVAVVTRSAGAASQTRYLHADHLGSTDVLTDEGGAPVERRSYDAFGARRSPVWGQGAPPPPSAETKLGFTGHDDDDDLGLVNMKGRLYDPALARFLTPDPYVPAPTFGQSWNRYSYTRNNFLAYVDPSGFDEAPVDPSATPAPPAGVMPDVWVYGKPREPRVPDTGPVPAVIDLATTGTSAPFSTPPMPIGDGVGPFEMATEIGIGIVEGTGEFALEMAKFTVLSALTFGGYGTWTLGESLWNGYQEDGILGALNALNPLFAVGQAGADASMAADDGDYRAAAAAGTKAALLLLSLVEVPEAKARGPAAARVADAAQATRPRPTTVALLETSEGTFPGASGTRQPLHPQVQTALDSVAKENRSPFHGNCAEPQCISRALEAGVNPAGGRMTAVRVRRPGHVAHGTTIPPCSSCSAVQRAFGID